MNRKKNKTANNEKRRTLKMRYLSTLLALLIALGSMTGCSSASEAGAEEETTTVTELTSLSVEYSDADLDDSWDAETATAITLSGSTASVEGSGAAVDGSTITITEEGTYVVTGTLSDGQILINAGEEDKVQLVLNCATITCSDGPAIYSVENDKLTVTLADGTTNRVEDGTAYTLEDGEDEPNAAIFSKSDLTINGDGTLVVNGNYSNGIVSKDDLVITGGNVTVVAVNDGIKGRDSIAICDGTFAITTTSGDGLQASNDEDVEKGWISIDGGIFTINAADDGLQAESLLQVTNGELDVTAVSDALHSNTNMLIVSGELTLTAEDDGLHADNKLTVEDGSILIDQSYEGLEAAYITVNGGSVDIAAQDDGFNAAGGNDSSATAEGAGAKDAFSENGDYSIRITGGNITVNADGDGIDSNGSIYFEGGVVTVSGPTNNGNGPMDYNGVCEITGGTLSIAGSSGMAQAPSDSSTQCSVTVYFSSAQAAGSTASLVDADGNTVISYSPLKQYQSIVFSSADLTQGETYTLLVNGTELTDVTLSATVTSIADDGSAATGGMGGGGMPGGDGQRPEGGQPGGGGQRPEGGQPETSE